MSPESDVSWIAKPFHFLKDLPKHLWHRYRNLRPLGKLFIWGLVVFYIALSAFFIVVTPARIFQSLYDLAQRLSHHPLGWLALGGIVGSPQYGPFPEAATHQIISPRLLPPLHWTYNCCDTMRLRIPHEWIWSSGNFVLNWICPCLFEFPVAVWQTPSALEFCK